MRDDFVVQVLWNLADEADGHGLDLAGLQWR